MLILVFSLKIIPPSTTETQ